MFDKIQMILMMKMSISNNRISRLNYLTLKQFSFRLVSVKYLENVIKNIPSNKASGGDIPIQILKQPGSS